MIGRNNFRQGINGLHCVFNSVCKRSSISNYYITNFRKSISLIVDLFVSSCYTGQGILFRQLQNLFLILLKKRYVYLQLFRCLEFKSANAFAFDFNLLLIKRSNQHFISFLGTNPSIFI